MAAIKQIDIGQYVKILEGWFSKLPSLPTSAREVLVKIAPWIALIFGVLGVLGIVSGVVGLLGLGAFGATLAPYGGMAITGASFYGIIILLLSLIPTVLQLLAFPGLKARKIAGWNYLLYSLAASVVISVIGGGFGSVFGAVIGAAIGLYVLFQIKSYYK